MTFKIINIIFIYAIDGKINTIDNKYLKKYKTDVFKKRVFKLLQKCKKRKLKKRFFVFIAKRRWRDFFYRYKPIRIYLRFSIKRRLRQFRWSTVKKFRKLFWLSSLFIFLFYFKIVHILNFYFFLLKRFFVYSFNSVIGSQLKGYFSRGKYIFEHMLLKTFLFKKKNSILVIGRKQYLPVNYSNHPMKISVFSTIKKSFFYEKNRLSYTDTTSHYLFLLKNFKKSNLFTKTIISNTDFFVKLNIKNYNYNLFAPFTLKKFSISPKINITSRQISVLKQVRLKIYNFYHKKSRNYKITKFFLKLSYNTTLLNWLLNWEFKLINIILRSKILRSYNQALDFISYGYIFVNSTVITNKDFLIKLGDLIQIPVNKQWFINDRLQTSSFNVFLKDLNKYIRKKRLFSTKYFAKFSKHEQPWLIENLRNFSKTPVYMEVDYSTLSIIILKNTVNANEVLPIYTNTFKPLTSRLYNWRYFY